MLNIKQTAIRAASGAVYVGLIVCSLLFGSWWGFPLLCCLFAGIALMEFYSLTQSADESRLTLYIDLTAGILLVGCAPYNATFSLIIVLAYMLVRMVAQIYFHDTDAIKALSLSYMGIVYVALPLMICTTLFSFVGWPLILGMFVMVWLNDTGAYLVGCTLGRHRLFPRISPKKSWEGFFGGMIFSIAAGAAYYYLAGEYFGGYPLWMLLGMGAVVSIFATWGDLIESLIKRTVGVKDSGSIMPGHGGILDRIDSLLMVVPALTLYLFLVNCF